MRRAQTIIIFISLTFITLFILYHTLTKVVAYEKRHSIHPSPTLTITPSPSPTISPTPTWILLPTSTPAFLPSSY